MDLNDDCQYLIFDHLRMNSLYSLARTSKYFEETVGNFVRRIFARKIMVLDFFSDYSKQYDYIITDEFIEIRNVRMAIKILTQFGRYIQNLKLQDVLIGKNIDEKRIKELYHVIHEHCSDTLSQLHLKLIDFDFFEFAKKPFTNVKNISLLQGKLKSLGNRQFNFQEMFPAMRILRLDSFRIDNKSALTLDFPKLEQLSADIATTQYSDYVTEPVIAELIRKNPQIRSVVLSHLSLDLLKVVANTLVNLEQLTVHLLSYSDQEDATIHFEHVKSFTISNIIAKRLPSEITFANLEEFKSHTLLGDDKYIDFIENNRNLKKICINGTKGLSNGDIERLASANLNVVEMFIVCDRNFGGEHLVQLIENSKNLKRLHLKILSTKRNESFDSEMEEKIQILRKQLGNSREFTYNVHENDVILTLKKA